MANKAKDVTKRRLREDEFPGLLGTSIILGFTGSLGSGCSYISEGIAKQYKYKRLLLSDILREEAKKRGLLPTVENLQNIGNDLRKEHGNSALVYETLKKIKATGLGPSYKGIIIDSIRNDGEVYVLKQFPNFYLFSIHADEVVRKRRCVGASKKFKTDKEFDDANKRDRSENYSHGQQVEKCNDLSDIIINNNEDFPSTHTSKKRMFINEVYDRYVSVIEGKIENLMGPDKCPTVDETLMTMAYTESMRSSCVKRKVGCIIALNRKYESGISNSISETVQIISSGHNEVTTGDVPCIFKDYEKCYRDYLQEKQAEKIHHCPKCGEVISFKDIICDHCGKPISAFVKNCPSCRSEVKMFYKCSKCEADVFKEFLLGGGKLLDMCRALHAEENALLNLIKVGSFNPDDIVLYTTTFPCNLCANKIAMTGIKNVVYADPYTMEDAKKTLEISDVNVRKFQGIKSSALFRLYK